MIVKLKTDIDWAKQKLFTAITKNEHYSGTQSILQCLDTSVMYGYMLKEANQLITYRNLLYCNFEFISYVFLPHSFYHPALLVFKHLDGVEEPSTFYVTQLFHDAHTGDMQLLPVLIGVDVDANSWYGFKMHSYPFTKELPEHYADLLDAIDLNRIAHPSLLRKTSLSVLPEFNQKQYFYEWQMCHLSLELLFQATRNYSLMA